VTRLGDWRLDLAYCAASEGSYAGRSLNSTRYSFDAARWTESVDEDGKVLFGGPQRVRRAQPAQYPRHPRP
jgi:hypothetical protein